VPGMLGGVALLVLGAFAPWALLRLIPLAEIASSAASSLGDGRRSAGLAFQRADAVADEGENWATRTAAMRRETQRTASGTDGAQLFAEAEGQRMSACERSQAGSGAPEADAADAAPAASAPPTAAPAASAPPTAETSAEEPPRAPHHPGTNVLTIDNDRVAFAQFPPLDDEGSRP
jgi:hypothetical protein